MKHEVLAKLDAELSGLRSVDVLEVGGHRFGVKTLTRRETSMARALMPAVSENMLQAFADSFVPQLAVALVSIDDTPVEEVWPAPTDGSAGEDIKRWRAGQVLAWLQDQPDAFVGTLWTKFADVREAQRERLNTLSTELSGTAEASA